jgi:DNA anti-recombination protein RmuC
MGLANSSAFDQFRTNHEVKALQQRMRARLQEARDQISQKIACAEAAEEIEKRVILEMREFFTEATRLAAQVLTEIHKKRAQELDAKIEFEIETFFEETKRVALDSLGEMRTASGPRH